MANPLTIFIKAIIGKSSVNENGKEIEEASKKGEMVARNAAKRMGIVEQVEIDAEAARKAAEAKTKNAIEKHEERIN